MKAASSAAEMMNDMNGLAVLPPLNNMPQWSRINTLDKARYPKRVVKDMPPECMVENASEDTIDANEDRMKSNPMNTMRVEHLQKSITFLRSQHQDILCHLHEEIDHLKRSNKELQFKIVMVQTPNGSAKQRHSLQSRQEITETHCASPVSVVDVANDMTQNEQSYQRQSQVSDEKLDELKVMFLEEEVKELRRFLREEKSKNQYLSNLVELAEKQKDKKKPDLSPLHHASAGSRPPESIESTGSSEQSMPGGVGALPFNATIDPLQVHPSHQPPRTPTIQECQVIMRHLHKLGDKQAHELNQLKCDLRDVLYSHKWSPDAYLLAKAYIADDDEREATQQNRLPRIPLRQPTKKLPDLAYLPRDAVSLPALKQTMGTKAAERRRRTQILQKARLHREVLH